MLAVRSLSFTQIAPMNKQHIFASYFFLYMYLWRAKNNEHTVWHAYDVEKNFQQAVETQFVFSTSAGFFSWVLYKTLGVMNNFTMYSVHTDFTESYCAIFFGENYKGGAVGFVWPYIYVQQKTSW